MPVPFIEENDQTRARQEHLEALRKLVGNVYPNKFERSHSIDPQREDTITAVVEKYRAFEPETAAGERPAPEAIELANQQLNQLTLRIAGRIASPPRVMGKAAFVHLSDGVTRIQIYVKRADMKGVSNDAAGGDVDGWELFNLLDHGDFIGVEGYLFITKTGELSLHVQQLQFLSKALLPLPDKMHGIQDPEIRQRQRYADLIAGSLKLERTGDELTPREVFQRRSKTISELRRMLEDHGYVEVETPMLTPKATGAAARAFETHHNALDIKLYARIAPELYLKRLLVGGFEKVYELNRNFRNEGIDRTHNPEFTMLEFYWAYADVNQMMDFCEEMIRATVFKVLGQTFVRYGEDDIDSSPDDLDFSQFDRLTMKEAILKYYKSSLHSDEHIDESILEDPRQARALASRLKAFARGVAALILEKEVNDVPGVGADSEIQYGQDIATIFELVAEYQLIQPTFIMDFPKAISPLSKASPVDPRVAERFELYINAMEVANGFSELNDPEEQHQRFLDQMSQREGGDEEAMVMDEDYIRALSYGMPPAAGIGIGIDRFVMLLTNQQSIRDVILFPHMRPERKPSEQEESKDKEGC